MQGESAKERNMRQQGKEGDRDKGVQQGGRQDAVRRLGGNSA